MKSYSTILFFALLGSAHADTLSLRNGTSVTGSWLGGDAGQITFLVNNQVRTYPRSDVSEVTFGPEPTASLPLAQPPQPPPASSKELKPGQTIDQVEATLGKPAQVFNVSGKRIYVYKDPAVKVTFQDGKLVDIE